MHSIPRFYLDKSNIKRKRFLLEDERIVRHMGMVLRLKKGDKIILFDGEGGEYEATLGFLSKKQAAGIVESENFVVNEASSKITLAQSLPRAGKLDDVIRMNTEVGVEEFILFESEYSVAKAGSVTESKIERLNKVALEALRQSEGNVAPVIKGAVSYTELLESTMTGYDCRILLHSRNTKNSQNLVVIKTGLKPGIKILVIIGPEGGFSPKEIKLARDNGCLTGYLNLPVLRTETAGVVVCSYLLLR
jgi:16S rRNA (uracil1498-N3)-methyltransferase